MRRHALLGILVGLLILGMWTLMQHQRGDGAPAAHPMWILFLALIPVGLAAMVWQRIRWAAMGCVIYGTVGLALDLATGVQVLTKNGDLFPILASSGISGVLNFLLILFGGQALLDVSQAPPPPGSRPPSPPSPSSSSAA